MLKLTIKNGGYLFFIFASLFSCVKQNMRKYNRKVNNEFNVLNMYLKLTLKVASARKIFLAIL